MILPKVDGKFNYNGTVVEYKKGIPVDLPEKFVNSFPNRFELYDADKVVAKTKKNTAKKKEEVVKDGKSEDQQA